MKCFVTVRFLIVFLTVVFMVLSGIAGERLYIYARTTCQGRVRLHRIPK